MSGHIKPFKSTLGDPSVSLETFESLMFQFLEKTAKIMTFCSNSGTCLRPTCNFIFAWGQQGLHNCQTWYLSGVQFWFLRNTQAQIIMLKTKKKYIAALISFAHMRRWCSCVTFRKLPTFSVFVYQAAIAMVMEENLFAFRVDVATFNPLIELPGRSRERWINLPPPFFNKH